MIKVLIDEDEDIIRKGIILTINWKSLGCEVVGEASNGIEGLEQIKKLKPDLIITDIKMPKMDGIEMLRNLRQDGNTTDVIILSAFNTFSYAQSALRLGAVDYIIKPFHDGELERSIKLIKNKIRGTTEEVSSDEFPYVSEEHKTKYISETMEYIKMHYNDPDICLSSIAENLEISEGHLSHVFKKETNLGPLNFLTHYRIHQAKLLLDDCRIKVYEVAERVGYKDIAYFSSTFKKITGMSPSEYQNKNAEAKKILDNLLWDY